MARGRLRILAATAATSALALVLSCSLGLDESKIAPDNEAGRFDSATGEDSGGDAGDGGTNPTLPEAGACTKDDECPTANHACLKARCDLAAKRCIYDVCRPMACNAGACDPAAKTCGAPKTYTYKVTQFQVGAPVQRLASVYPWLFVQTQTGIVAFNVSNPTAAPPPKVPVSGLGFVPTQMVATANRVFFLSPPAGPANAASTVPLAWIDVPADPFVTRIDAHTVLATYSRPANETAILLPRESDTALLYSIVGGPQPNFPATIVQPPLVEPLTLTATPILFQAGQTAANVISGSRFLMQQVDGNGMTTFGIVNGAGTTAPTNGGVYSFADAGPVAGPQAFAVAPNGAVFWSIASLNMPPGPPETLTRAVRGQFLFANGTADYDRPGAFDVEVYTNPAVGPGASVAGPVTMLDAETVMILAAARENPGAQTAVQFAKRNPLGIVKNADGTTPKRLVLPIAVSTFVGATSSNGVAYAAANETMPTPNSTVYVFDPACPIQ